jgi:hypothetical protein
MNLPVLQTMTSKSASSSAQSHIAATCRASLIANG